VFLILCSRSTALAMLISNGSSVEVVTSVQRRRRSTFEEKIGWMRRRAIEPEMTASLAARAAGVASSQVFQRKRLFLEGALSAVGANEPVDVASRLQEAPCQIKRLSQALGRNTLENGRLREAVDSAIARKRIACSPVLP
jgi:transposase